MAYTYTLNANGITGNRTLTVPDQAGTLVAATGTPSVGQVPIWNGTSWAPGAAGGGAYFKSASALASQLQAAPGGYLDVYVAGMNPNSVILGVKAVVSQNNFTNSVGTLLNLDFNLYDAPKFPAGGGYIVTGALYATAGTIADGEFSQGFASRGLASGWNAPFFRINNSSLGSLNPNNALLTLSLLCMDV